LLLSVIVFRDTETGRSEIERLEREREEAKKEKVWLPLTLSEVTISSCQYLTMSLSIFLCSEHL